MTTGGVASGRGAPADEGVTIWAEFVVEDATQFLRTARTLVDYVRANEPDVISYEWFADSARRIWHVTERYRSSRAFVDHSTNETLRPWLTNLLSVSQLVRVSAHGRLSNEAHTVLDRMRAVVFEPALDEDSTSTADPHRVGRPSPILETRSRATR